MTPVRTTLQAFCSASTSWRSLLGLGRCWTICCTHCPHQNIKQFMSGDTAGHCTIQILFSRRSCLWYRESRGLTLSCWKTDIAAHTQCPPPPFFEFIVARGTASEWYESTYPWAVGAPLVINSGKRKIVTIAPQITPDAPLLWNLFQNSVYI